MASDLEELQARYGERYKWKVMLTVMIGTMTMSLSSTIVNVALPQIMDKFAIGHTAGQWLVTAFLSSMAVGMLVNAWLVDRFGARKTYLMALSIFILSAVAGGFALSFEMLVVVRILQGFIAGMVQPLALLMMYSVFPLRQRGKAMGLYGMGVILGPTFGPVVGGILVDLVSWRAVFLVVLPSCFYALYLSRTYLAHQKRAERVRKLDFSGLVMLAGWVVALLWALSNGSVRGWASDSVLFALGLFVVLFTAFAVRQVKGRAPLLALAVFRYPGFGAGCSIAMITGAGLFGSVYLLPIMVQTVLSESASTAGLLLMPAGLAMALTFGVAGRMTDRLSPGSIVATGLVFFALSCFVLSFAGGASSLALIAAMAALGRVGLALTMPPVVVRALRVLPQDLVNQGTGVISFSRQFGGALGVSFSAILLQENSQMLTALVSHLDARAATPGYQDAFLLFMVLFLVGFYPLFRMRAATPAGEGSAGPGPEPETGSLKREA